MKRWLLTSSAAVLLLVKQPLAAQAVAVVEPVSDADASDARAQALFLEGRELLQTDRITEACGRLEQSLDLRATVGVLLNLGLCHIKRQKLAKAFEYYRRAELMAVEAGDQDRADAASRALARITGSLGSLTAITLSRRQNALGQVEVRVDNVLVSNDSWGLRVFVDPGDHHVSVRLDESRVWHSDVRVRAGEFRVLAVPEIQPSLAVKKLNLLPSPATIAVQAPSKRAQPPVFVTPSEARQSDLGTQRWAALTSGVAGVLGAGASVVSGAMAKAANRASAAYCNKTCTEQGTDYRTEAYDHATRATVFATIAVSALVAGTVLWLTASSPKPSRQELATNANARLQ